MSFLMLKLKRESISTDNFTLFENLFDWVLEICRAKASSNKLGKTESSEAQNSCAKLEPFSCYPETLTAVSESRGVLIAPAKIFNHDRLVVWQFGNWSARLLYALSLCLSIGVFLTGLLAVKPSTLVCIVWIVALLIGVFGASANGNLGDGLLSQVGLLLGVCFLLGHRSSVALGLFSGWVTWFFCSLALATAFRVTTDAIINSEQTFFRLIDQAKVKFIPPSKPSV